MKQSFKTNLQSEQQQKPEQNQKVVKTWIEIPWNLNKNLHKSLRLTEKSTDCNLQHNVSRVNRNTFQMRVLQFHKWCFEELNIQKLRFA